MSSYLPLLVNTTSKCEDAWDMFFGSLWEDAFGYVMCDVNEDFGPKFITLVYDPELPYREQILSCLNGCGVYKKLTEEIVLYTAEDNVMMGHPDIESLDRFANLIRTDPTIQWVKLIKGLDKSGEHQHKQHKDLVHLNPLESYFFTMQPTIWDLNAFRTIYETGPDGGIAGLNYDQMFETLATETCRELGYGGMYYYNGEMKRGDAHHHSDVFPFIASAIIKGKWNTSEYPELYSLFDKYNIDPNIRGIR